MSSFCYSQWKSLHDSPKPYHLRDSHVNVIIIVVCDWRNQRSYATTGLLENSSDKLGPIRLKLTPCWSSDCEKTSTHDDWCWHSTSGEIRNSKYRGSLKIDLSKSRHAKCSRNDKKFMIFSWIFAIERSRMKTDVRENFCHTFQAVIHSPGITKALLIKNNKYL